MWTKENDGQIPYFVERAKLVAKEVQVSEEFRSRSSSRKESDGWGRGETTNPSSRVRGGRGGHHGRGGYDFRGRGSRNDRRNDANRDQGRDDGNNSGSPSENSGKNSGNDLRSGWKRGRDKNGAWTRKCLNDKCNETHRIEDCPITNYEDKNGYWMSIYRSSNDCTGKSVHDSQVGP